MPYNKRSGIFNTVCWNKYCAVCEYYNDLVVCMCVSLCLCTCMCIRWVYAELFWWGIRPGVSGCFVLAAELQHPAPALWSPGHCQLCQERWDICQKKRTAKRFLWHHWKVSEGTFTVILFVSFVRQEIKTPFQKSKWLMWKLSLKDPTGIVTNSVIHHSCRK